MQKYAIRMGEYVALERAHVRYIVADMVPRPGLVVLVGPPKAGKSFLAIQLAHALAHSMTFLGRDTFKQRVLYLMLESELVFKDRIQKLLACGYLQPNAQIFVPHPDNQPLSFNILKTETQTWIYNVIEETDPDVIVIDPLRELHNENEDKASEMKPVGDAIMELVGNRSVVVVHHTPKIREDTYIDPVNLARGSNYLAGKADTVWLLLDNKAKQTGRLHIVPRFSENIEINLVRTTRGLWLLA